jgi:hypothetical protein
MNDVAQKLVEHAESSPQHLRDTLHIDVHSFTVTDNENTSNPLPNGWGYGVNILCLHGDYSQYEMAIRMKLVMDTVLNGVIPETTIIMHDNFPKHTRHDDSNAMIEISRIYGAMSLLVEFPTKLDDSNTYVTTCSEDLLVKALLAALSHEVNRYRR